MALISPTTLVSFIWGAHFYNTAHDYSDYDIVSVVLPRLEDFLAGQKYRPKQKHGTEWLGNKMDITRYSLDHFLSLIGKGNIQLIELALYYDPQYVVYYSDRWTKYYDPIRKYALNSLAHTNWGHIRGWMHETLKRIDKEGLTLKSAHLMWRMIIEAQMYMKEKVLICKWPDIIDYAPDEHQRALRFMYNARTTGCVVSKDYMIDQEAKLHKEVEKIEIMFAEYEPVKQIDFNRDIERGKILKWIRTDQFAEQMSKHLGVI